MIRPILAGVALLTFAATAAVAADVPPSLPKPRASLYVPFFSWNGAYVGVNVGDGFGTSNWTDTVTLASTGNFNVNGGMAGLTLGTNMQVLGAWVFGAEADLNWSGLKGSATPALCGGTCTTSNSWIGTARGRIGYAWDRLMPYFTGGGAFGSVKISDGLGTATSTRFGWALGVGFEYAALDRWTVKLEYIYVDLGKAKCDATCSGGNPFDVAFKAGIVRAGVNYRF